MPDVELEVPGRVVGLPQARARFGRRVDRLVAFLARTDPLADAAAAALDGDPGQRSALERGLAAGVGAMPAGAAPELRELIAAAERLPFWADLARCDRAGRLLFRAGPIGGLVLGARSLAAGYCSPAGNKPLALSGQLTRGRTAGKRLAETGRFVVATCSPGGLAPHAPGWQLALRVRLIHASVRRLVVASGRWRADEWGAPINQHDLVGTTLLFSLEWVDGVRACGLAVSDAEAEDYLHLWRVSGWLTGVDPELLPASIAEARVLHDMIAALEGPPDEDSRTLVRALVEELPVEQASTEPARRLAPLQIDLGYGIVRSLLGAEVSDALELPRTPWRFAIPATRPLVAAVERARALPGVERAAIALGRRYWERAIEDGLGGSRASFEPPRRLVRAAEPVDGSALVGRGDRAG